MATPSGGTHRYFTVPGRRCSSGNTAGQLGPLVDTRGAGGYVVAAPTIIGRPYRVIEDRRPAPLPDWLAQLLTHAAPTAAHGRQRARRRPASASWPPGHCPRYVTAALAGEIGPGPRRHAGQRNHTLFSAAVALGQLVGGGQLDEHTARDRLREACAGHIPPARSPPSRPTPPSPAASPAAPPNPAPEGPAA